MSPRQLVIKLLDRLDQTNSYADLLFENEIRKNRLSDQDKGLIQEIFFGAVRWRNQLDWIIKHLYQGSFEKTPRFFRHILQISLYQLIYMDRIPAYAAINEAVMLAKSKGGAYWGNKVNGILRTFQRGECQVNLPDLKTEPIEYIAIKSSHPAWLVERWIRRYGIEEAISFCEANNRIPNITLRTNRLKINTEELRKFLTDNNIEVSLSPYLKDFLITERLPDLSSFEAFENGLFSIQDASAGLACELLAPGPGETMVDLCAAPGGKTTYLAELAQDKATILAVDIHKSRLNLIRQNLSRLGLKSVQLIQADGAQFSCDPVDKIIVDVPCSGLGVLSKRVDLRWKRTPEQIDGLTQLQSKLLQNAAKLLKPGGVLVYCTCTIEPQENEQMVERFLNVNKQFQLENASNYVSNQTTDSSGCIYTFPHHHGIDGSFAARLVKE